MTDSHGLILASGQPFATSAVGYLDSSPDIREPLARIYVRFRPQGTDVPYLALLDTGGHYCILNTSVAAEIQDHLTDKIGSFELRTGHGLLRGELYTHTITLSAEIGSPLEIESTVFVSPDWHGPCFLGYAGFLDRIRFAVDPQANYFYFGPLV